MLLTPLSAGKMMLISACFKSPFSRAASAGAIASKIGQIGQGLSVGYFVGGELRALLSARPQIT